MNRNQNITLDSFSGDCVANTQKGNAFWVDAITMEIKRIEKNDNQILG